MLSKVLFFIGLLFIAVAFIFWMGEKGGVSWGKLPGDISYSSEKYSFSFPIITSLILSVVLTVVINIILVFFRK